MDQGEARRRTLFLGAVGLLVFYLAYLAREAVVPLAIALLLAYVLAPLVAALEKRGFSRVGSVTTLFVAFFGSAGLALAFGLPPLLVEARALVRAAVGEPARTVGMTLPGDLGTFPDRDPPATFEDLLKAREAVAPELLGPEDPARQANWERKIRETLETRGEEAAREFRRRHAEWRITRHDGRVVIFADRNRNGRFEAGYAFDAAMAASRWARDSLGNPGAAAAVEDLGIDVVPSLSESFLSNTGDFARGALGFLGTLFGLLAWGLVIPLYTFFFLMRLDDVWRAFVGSLPGTHRDRVVLVLSQIHRMLIGFFRGRLLTMLLKGLFVAAGLGIAGAPFWPVFGAAAGLLTIVPAVGPLLAAVPAVILSYREGGPATAGLAAGVLVAAEIVEGYVLIPKMVGREVGLHPMAVITSILVGGALLGVFGIVIAIPLAAGAKIVWAEFVVPAIRAKAAEPPRPPAGGA